MEDLQLMALDKNESYSQKAYKQLKQLILTNQIKAGVPLNERELAQSLSVSRTPIRDALRMLEQEGWVVQQGKNKVVSLLTWKSVRDLMEIRLPLELLSFDLAVKKLTPENIETFERLSKEMDVIAYTGDPANYYSLMEKDTAIHMLIAHTAANDRIEQIMQGLCEQIVRTSVLSIQYGEDSMETYAERHAQLLELLRGGRFEEAREELKQHIAIWENRMRAIPQVLNINRDEDWVF